ncbi:MAG: hypothetical protein HQL03_11755 [Nitrospirae bacterium]|nr:hypothetical protein [Nitrospirota bacterium]MBF0591724.1 hypothetical protein [Nitrospirota bacterium]
MVQLIMKIFLMLVGVLFCTVVAVSSGPFFTAPGHSWLTVAGAADSSFTQADRDRMIRMEDRMTRMEDGLKATNQRLDDNLKAINQRIDDSLKAINQRFDTTNQKIDDGLKATNQRIDDSIRSINQKLDDNRGLMYVLLSGMFILVGFILWDRRTTLAPVVRTTRELEDRTEKLVLAIKEKAEKDPELKEALRHAGLL